MEESNRDSNPENKTKTSHLLTKRSNRKKQPTGLLVQNILQPPAHGTKSPPWETTLETHKQTRTHVCRHSIKTAEIRVTKPSFQSIHCSTCIGQRGLASRVSSGGQALQAMADRQARWQLPQKEVIHSTWERMFVNIKDFKAKTNNI